MPECVVVRVRANFPRTTDRFKPDSYRTVFLLGNDDFPRGGRCEAAHWEDRIRPSFRTCRDVSAGRGSYREVLAKGTRGLCAGPACGMLEFLDRAEPTQGLRALSRLLRQPCSDDPK